MKYWDTMEVEIQGTGELSDEAFEDYLPELEQKIGKIYDWQRYTDHTGRERILVLYAHKDGFGEDVPIITKKHQRIDAIRDAIEDFE